MQNFVELKLKQDVLVRYGRSDILCAGGQQRVEQNCEKLSNAPSLKRRRSVEDTYSQRQQ